MSDGRGRRLSEIGSWVLVLCAVATTVLVVRREFSQGATALPTNRQATYVEEWRDALATGVRSGSPDAPVQVVEFGDFQCPYCARFDATARAMLEKYPDQIAFTFVHLPLPQHEFAEPAARAAECAEAQGHFKGMRSLLFDKQPEFGAVAWTDLAIRIGVPDIALFDACMNDRQPLARIEGAKALADRMGILGTPTIIVNGWKWPGTPSAEDIDKIVDNVLGGREPSAHMDFSAARSRN
jgi:protein-disulfide isomerase